MQIIIYSFKHSLNNLIILNFTSKYKNDKFLNKNKNLII